MARATVRKKAKKTRTRLAFKMGKTVRFSQWATSAEQMNAAQTAELNEPRPESRKTAMAAKPFWTLRVHDKRDVLVARHKARQMAHLLHYPPLAEACIAAGVFAIAAQARDHYEIYDLCFQLEHHQLIVFARPLHADDGMGTGATRKGSAEAGPISFHGGAAPANTATRSEPSRGTAPLLKLAKALPEAARGFAVDDLAFLIGRINEQAPVDLFGELNKQNQEILFLLHLLNHPQEQLGQKSTSAA
jgi:hypothetical protein